MCSVSARTLKQVRPGRSWGFWQAGAATLPPPPATARKGAHAEQAVNPSRATPKCSCIPPALPRALHTQDTAAPIWANFSMEAATLYSSVKMILPPPQTDTLEKCAEACLADAKCVFWSWCPASVTAGCGVAGANGTTSSTLKPKTCILSWDESKDSLAVFAMYGEDSTTVPWWAGMYRTPAEAGSEAAVDPGEARQQKGRAGWGGAGDGPSASNVVRPSAGARPLPAASHPARFPTPPPPPCPQASPSRSPGSRAAACWPTRPPLPPCGATSRTVRVPAAGGRVGQRAWRAGGRGEGRTAVPLAVGEAAAALPAACPGSLHPHLTSPTPTPLPAVQSPTLSTWLSTAWAPPP